MGTQSPTVCIQSHTVYTVYYMQTDRVVFASQVNMADVGCQTVYDKCGLQNKVETMILRNELNIAHAPSVGRQTEWRCKENEVIYWFNISPLFGIIQLSGNTC